MFERPQLNSHYRAARIEGEGIVLTSELHTTLLQGRLFEKVIPLLDGRRSADDLIDQLQGQVEPPEVYYVLAQLERRKLLVEGVPETPDSLAALWALQEIDPGSAERRLADTTVMLTSFGAAAVSALRALLEALQVRVAEAGPCGVVVTDDYLCQGLQDYNRQALAAGRSWLLVRPNGCQIWIGPLFRPGKTGCWECLATRLRANREIDTYLQSKQGCTDPVPAARAQSPATLQVAWGLAAHAVATWVARGELPALEGQVQSLDLRTWKTEAHVLVRRPQCAACGNGNGHSQTGLQPLLLESRRKQFTEDGGHRVVRPEATLEQYGRHVSPISGVVPLLERRSLPRDGSIHVYLAGFNPALRSRNLRQVQYNLRSLAAGKGTTDVQARASALGEALERFSAVHQGNEPRCRARLRDLGDAGIHPNTIMLFSDRQYQEREAANARGKTFGWVPSPFDPEAVLEWSPVWSLTRRAARYLPTAFCYFAHPEADEGGLFACSNGNAAGNTLEEAILQGFLELVERDSFALWWYNRLPRPAVDLDSFGEPYLHQLRATLHNRQRDLWVLDLTADLDIPVFVALSRRLGQAKEQIMMGFGAHLDARIALLRAVTEMNQMLAWVLTEEGERPLEDRLDDPDTLTWLRTATVANQPYLLADSRTPARKATAYPSQATDDLKEDVLACQARVERLGLEMLVLDQTRPDIGLPVVKVVVPGLRHLWARFAPGRLYDIPVQLGWLPQPLSEEQLNPIPMFL